MNDPRGESPCTRPFPGLGLTDSLSPQGPVASSDSHLPTKASQASVRTARDARQCPFKTNPPPLLPPDCFMQKHGLVATGSADCCFLPKAFVGTLFLPPLSFLFLWFLKDPHLLRPRPAAATERRRSKAESPGEQARDGKWAPCPCPSLSCSLSPRLKGTERMPSANSKTHYLVSSWSVHVRNKPSTCSPASCVNGD